MLSLFVARSCIVAALAAAVLHAQTQAGQSDFARAYASLSAKDYDSAVASFRKGLLLDPTNAPVHKDLAYTLLKMGENSEARDEFEKSLKINSHDETAALEFAFLAYETGKPIEARRMFDRLRKQASAATRGKAEQAFQNIDRPLADGIARWKQALARSTNPMDISTFSAHWELARTAELRDDLPLAGEQYEICRTLKPQLSEVLLILARVWRQLNRVEDAKAAVLAASRQTNPRTAEQGLEQWGTRYPYPYEFVNAIAVDPQNVALRRELAYLYLAMSKQSEAVEQFEKILAIDPNDRLSQNQLELLKHPHKTASSPPPAIATGASSANTKQMGIKSLNLGYARDAIKYLRKAHDEDPDDQEVMLKLGWAYNYAKDDQEALQWFDRVRHSS
ncbi:MAG: tetratricopeptide repeat protein, partial [Acidobacteriaceae bacterium]|nr:tetratricopeptide repeat protein [Acidobacteriaceae bacterium]